MEGFSQTVAPLTQLTRKDKKLIWGTNQDKSFQELKIKLTTTLILAVPSGTKGYVIYSDTSKLGWGVF